MFSQSKIKQLNGPNLCPRKFKLSTMEEKYPSLPSESMIKGQLFEWLALESPNREGQIPKLKKKNNGQPTADEVRIVQQAQLAKKLIPMLGMTPVSNRVAAMIDLDDPGPISISVLLDLLVWYQPKGAAQARPYIVDTKLTANINSTFGDFCWGTPWNMDHTQAYIYMNVMSQLLGQPVGFIYLVFDYKTNPDYTVIEMADSAVNQSQVREALRRAYDTLMRMDAAGYPPVPSYEACRTCTIPGCSLRTGVKEVVVVNYANAPSYN